MKLLILIIVVVPCLSDKQNVTTERTEIEDERFLAQCRDRDRLIGSKEEDLFSLVDLPMGKTVLLQCHFCNENDDKQPKIWYKQDKLYNATAYEVKIDMDNNITFSRVHVTLEHSLVIKNTTYNDSGLFLCESIDGLETAYKFNYYIDFVSVQNSDEVKGDQEEWRKYHDQHFYPINKLFRSSSSPEFVRLRENLGLTVELYTEWDSWTSCDACGKPVGKGISTRFGHCRVKVIPINKRSSLSKTRNESEKNLIYMDRVSCYSQFFQNLFPYIANMTKNIPNFKETKYCKGVCKIDTAMSGWITGKTKSFKYHKSYVLVQGSHLTLTCPESSLEHTILWRRNGKTLTNGDSVPPPKGGGEPHITVDTFGNLYLREVTSKEEGNYTCQVDKIRMQQVRIFVVSKTRLLTEALVRHLKYLGFVLSLTVTCYCAGLGVLWRNRKNYKSYRDLKKEENREKRFLLGIDLHQNDFEEHEAQKLF